VYAPVYLKVDCIPKLDSSPLSGLREKLRLTGTAVLCIGFDE